MKNLFLILTCSFSIILFAQEQDSTQVYKKRVLDNIEIDFLTSYYEQDGENAAVTGGIGTEDLQDIATDIVVSIPLNKDDILSFITTISAYTSASSSNINPFSGASNIRDDNDSTRRIIGSPWVASSGASKSDIWFSTVLGYSHSSDNRNRIWGANLNFAVEYDYVSFGFGANHTWLFNQKNTKVDLNSNVYIDTWSPIYPTELSSLLAVNFDLNDGFFKNVDILNQDGNVTNKLGYNTWSPVNKKLLEDFGRNTFATSFSLSQILNKKAQFSVFADVILQKGLLSHPSQRVYFGDRANYYIGDGGNINNYTSSSNTSVFQLADDIERLPNSRTKLPIGMRFNYYINEFLVLKTYYRYYTDNWGIIAHTAELELPIKLGNKFTLYPSYRYYEQTKSDYFAPYETHSKDEAYYTSDYDLSAFNAKQMSLGLRYTDIFTKTHLWKFNLKQVDLKYSHYQRNSTFKSDIVSLGFKFVFK